MEFRKTIVNTLRELMLVDDKIVLLDADLSKPNGTSVLYKEFPTRCFNVGIAEANMASVAAGLSAAGFKPIIVSFAPFATRRIFDQIAVSIAYAKQNVKIIGTDPGITAELNGGTHMSFEDVALTRTVPGMTVYDAIDDVSLAKALPSLINDCKNVYIRVPRKASRSVFTEDYNYTFNKADVLVEGCDATIISSGIMAYEAKEAAKILAEKGIKAEVIAVSTIKPLDKDTILNSLKKTNHCITIENHFVCGGLYGAIAEMLCMEYPMHVCPIGVNDEFGQVGTFDDLAKYYKLTCENIVNTVIKELNK